MSASPEQSILLIDHKNPKSGVRTASVYQPLFLGPVADGPTNFFQVMAFSSKPYSWACPVHTDEVWEAAPVQVSRAMRGLWLSRCPKCIAGRGLFVTTYPKMASYALDDVSEFSVRYVHDHRLAWECPKCGRRLLAGLVSAPPLREIEDDPERLVTRCGACSGRSLLAYPDLARQFVRCGETGETDPGLVTPGATPAGRNRMAVWCCEVCQEHFEVSMRTAVGISASTSGQGVLHKKCRPEPVNVTRRKVEADRKKAAAEEKLAKVEARVAARLARQEKVRRDAEAARAEKQRRLGGQESRKSGQQLYRQAVGAVGVFFPRGAQHEAREDEA